jgi:hypothetical protein
MARQARTSRPGGVSSGGPCSTSISGVGPKDEAEEEEEKKTFGLLFQERICTPPTTMPRIAEEVNLQYRKRRTTQLSPRTEG